MTAIGAINRVELMNFSVAVLLSLGVCCHTPGTALWQPKKDKIACLMSQDFLENVSFYIQETM